MNRPAKISLVSSIFVITGLCGSLSQAAPEVKDKPEQYAATTVASQSIAKSVSYSYTYPSITSEIFSESKSLSLPRLSANSRQPMQGIQVADFAHIAPNKFKKKNAIFEFAAKFNDKLQQILAIFDFSSAQATASKELTNSNSQKRKVHLTSSIGNCIVNKSN